MACRLSPLMCHSPHKPMCSTDHQLLPFSTLGGPPPFLPIPGTLDLKKKTKVSPSSFPGHIVEELCKSLRLNWGPKGGSGAQAAVAFGLGVKYPQGVGRDKLPGRRGGDQRLKIPEFCSVSQFQRICMEAYSPPSHSHPPLSN